MAKTIKGRTFNIMQYLNHPQTQEKLIDLDELQETLDKYKTIKRYAWILHDQDVWTEEDEAKADNDWTKAGEKKPPHVHIVISTEKASTDVEMIARWLKIPSNFIDIPKGVGAFLDCVQYLTHEEPEQQEKGKYLYDNELVHANFDWRKELDDRAYNQAEYGADLSKFDQMRFDVMYKGKTLWQCENDDPLILMNKLKPLQSARAYYLANKATVPSFRFNFYVSGGGGEGKGLMSRGLARTFFPSISADKDLFFVVGADNVGFEGYDGQPVIIWDDMRSFEIIDALGGIGNVFKTFDTHPVRSRQNVKFGSTMLINTINIVNSVEPYEVFLKGLSKQEDQRQANRRFPFIICLEAKTIDDKGFIGFDFLVNRGYAENTDAFSEYIKYQSFVCNFRSLENRYLPNKRKEYLTETKAQLGLLPGTVEDVNKKHLSVGISDDDFNEEIRIIRAYNEKASCPKDVDFIEGQISFDDIEKEREDN